MATYVVIYIDNYRRCGLYFLDGAVMGIIVAAPLGPVGLLCVRRTLMHGLSAGRLSGLGAATAHSMYGLIVGLGLTGISGFILKGQYIIGIAGGSFLCYLGIKTFYAKTHHSTVTSAVSTNRLHHYFSTLALAVTNPLTILSFIGIFAGFGVHSDSFVDPLLLIAGIFIGSITWWLLLTFVVSLFRHRISTKSFLIINRISVISGF